MHTNTYRRSFIMFAAAALITGCGGSDGGMSLPSIKLSGPISTALAANDQSTPTADGSTDIATTLSNFPAAALQDFATRFPAMVADELYRMVTYQAGSMTGEIFGIEGEDAAETSEVEALYSADGTFSHRKPVPM
ncbi:MAG: hypothetical protein AAF404_14315 [Pseudomonadota bacterium]